MRPVVQRLLDQIEAAAIVSNVHGDLLAANALGRALYAPVFESVKQPANSARFTFLDPAAPDFYPDWERRAESVKPHRIAENFDVFDFTLSGEEVAAIDALDRGVRGGPDPEQLSPETYPKVVDNS